MCLLPQRESQAMAVSSEQESTIRDSFPTIRYPYRTLVDLISRTKIFWISEAWTPCDIQPSKLFECLSIIHQTPDANSWMLAPRYGLHPKAIYCLYFSVRGCFSPLSLSLHLLGISTADQAWRAFLVTSKHAPLHSSSFATHVTCASRYHWPLSHLPHAAESI